MERHFNTAGPLAMVVRLCVAALCGMGCGCSKAVAAVDRAKSLIQTEDAAASGGAYALWAEIVMEGIGNRTWIVSDADDAFNAHLEASADRRGRTVHIISMAKDFEEDYREGLSQLITAEKIGGKKCADLATSLKKGGILPFMQDWFDADPDVCSKVLLIGTPDIWRMGGYFPMPSNLAFAGLRSGASIVPDGWTGEGEVERLQKLWARLSKKVTITKDLPENERLRREWVRRRFGMIANNLAFMLEEVGRDEEALDTYSAIMEIIDPENASAVLNAFDLVRRMKKPSEKLKKDIELRMKNLDNPKKRHLLWSLSRSYGYVRNPELMARMGFAWARSGAFVMGNKGRTTSGAKKRGSR